VHRATVLNYESVVADGEADDLPPSGDRGPDHVLVDRERPAYLSDAVLALPERLRAVVIGYFYQERPMLEIAAELGVTESRVSQLRAEVLILLRDGLNAHLDPDTFRPSPGPRAAWPSAGPPPRRHRRLLGLPGPPRRGPAIPARAGR
jgi:RNA polymerase sigma factor for flagellar operon FliA